VRRKRLSVFAAGACVALAALAAGPDRPDDETDLVAAADRLRQAGDNELALVYYNRALAQDPGSGAALAGAAASFEALDEAEALSLLAEAQALPAASLNPSSQAILAALWARRGAADKASDLLRPDADVGRGSLTRGQLYLARGDFPRAIKDLKEARAAGEAAAAYYLAEALLAAGRCDEAELYLNEFLRDFPYVARARCARGEIYYARGDNRRADAEFHAALRYDPADTRALFDLAVLASQRRDYAETIRRCGDVLSLDPWDRRAFAYMVATYRHVDPAVAADMQKEFERRFLCQP